MTLNNQTIKEINKLSFSVRNVKGLSIFKNKPCLSYHMVVTLIEKQFGTGASTAVGSSTGVVCLKKANFIYLFVFKIIWFVFHIHENRFAVQLHLRLFLFS